MLLAIIRAEFYSWSALGLISLQTSNTTPVISAKCQLDGNNLEKRYFVLGFSINSIHRDFATEIRQKFKTVTKLFHFFLFFSWLISNDVFSLNLFNFTHFY